jgi:gas vesicle protein
VDLLQNLVFPITEEFRIRKVRWSCFVQCLATILSICLIWPSPMYVADKVDIATSALEFGGSIGKLLWVEQNARSNIAASEADRYTHLAYQIKEQIELGRASSSLVKGNFDVLGTTLAYSALVDPEPLSKAVAGVAAWGAKKTGDAIGQMVIQQSQDQAKAILAAGLKNSGLSENELKSMSAEELRGKVSDLKVGGQKLRDILKDSPDSLQMLEANAVDIATSIGVEALARSQATDKNVQAIKTDLLATNQQIKSYQQEVQKHLDTVNNRLSDLEQATTDANAKLNVLETQVQGNSKVIQTLASVSFAGWSSIQKLQAVQGGLFPELNDSQKTALIASLTSDIAREKAIDAIQQAASDLGNLATIARNIGLPNDLVTGLKGAQVLATGVAQFATGNYLGAVASVTSLVGLGAPDAGAERHAAMMKYLQQQFAIVNQKLDKIIDLQVQTLNAIAALAKEQRQFRQEVLSQLDRIEDTVLKSNQILQAIVLNQWTDCRDLINGPLNGQFEIPSRDTLTKIIRSSNVNRYAGGCYSTMVGFLDAYVKPANWSAQIISAVHFPTSTIAATPALEKGWDAFQSQQNAAYEAARDFVLAKLPEAKASSAMYLARFAQPVVNTNYAATLWAAYTKQGVQDRFASFKCNQSDVLSPALRDLICFGTVPNRPVPPLSNRWENLLNSALIGPQSEGLIDTGLTLAVIADFAQTKNDSFVFVDTQAIEGFAQNGPSDELQKSLHEHKGSALLQKLQWLTEAAVLQQSIAYGNYTAQLIEETLYDPTTKSLNVDPKKVDPLKQRALWAMQTNPVLARNVVLLGMRHAIEDSPQGADHAGAVQYSQTYYALGLKELASAQGCSGSVDASYKLSVLFPGWKFGYWVTADGKKADASLEKCPLEFEPDPKSNSQLPKPGPGVGVSIGDFYVLLPSAPFLSTGSFDQSDSLRLALANRDRVSQAIIDRNVGETVKTLAGNGPKSKSIAADTAFALLNEGWDWQIRRKSN